MSFTDRVLTFWVRLVTRRPLVTVLLCLAATVGAAYYTAGNLKIDTDRSKLLSKNLPFRKDYERMKERFPKVFTDLLVVVVDAPTPEQADDASRRFAKRMEERRDLFEDVYLPRADPYLLRHGLLLQSEKKIEDIAGRLTEIQPFLGRLTRDPTLSGLFSMLRSALEAETKGTKVDLGPVLEKLAATMRGVLGGKSAPLSWQELMQNETATPDDLRRTILVHPKLDYKALFPGAEAMDAVEGIRKDLHMDGSGPVRARFTGGVAMDQEELESVSRGAEWIAALALLLIAVLLYLGLHSKRLVLIALGTLVAGLVWSTGFATVAIGHLNLISVAFGALYLGLGVDYAIHLCFREQELRAEGVVASQALERAVRDVGGSLIACAFTTAFAFFAFFPTSYRGVAELGLIAGTGIFIALFLTLTVLPALMTMVPSRRRPPVRLHLRVAWLRNLLAFPVHHALGVRIGAVLLGAGAIALLPEVRFDYDTLHLGDPNTEAIRTSQDLMRTSSTSPLSISMLAPDRKAAVAEVERLDTLSSVKSTLWIGDFIPKNQEEKLATLSDLSLVLGPDLSGEKAPPPTLAQQKAAIESLKEELTAYGRSQAGRNDKNARAFLATLDSLDARLRRLGPAAGDAMLQKVQEALLQTLPHDLELLRDQMATGPVTAADLPAALKSRWVSADGEYRIEAYPKRNLSNTEALRTFVDQVRSVAPHASDAPVQMLESGDAVVGAFQQAFLWALLATIVALLVMVRSVKDTLIVLAPLLLAGLLTGAFTVIASVPFNFANVIALPLLLGIGVDSGIHLVHRARSARMTDESPLVTSTARAVLYSTLTTVFSFGNLALSPHRGTASMGILLAVGTTLTLLCTLGVVPALLTPLRRRSRKEAVGVGAQKGN